MASTIETTGATLRKITGWTEIDFVGDNDSIFVHFGHSGRPYALWTDASGVARELGQLTASELDALAPRTTVADNAYAAYLRSQGCFFVSGDRIACVSGDTGTVLETRLSETRHDLLVLWDYEQERAWVTVGRSGVWRCTAEDRASRNTDAAIGGDAAIDPDAQCTEHGCARWTCDADHAPSPVEPIAWARTAEAGDYLAEYADDGLTAEEDTGSRCGYSDDTLDAVDRVLRKRGMTLEANDRGLVASR